MVRAGVGGKRRCRRTSEGYGTEPGRRGMEGGVGGLE